MQVANDEHEELIVESKSVLCIFIRHVNRFHFFFERLTIISALEKRLYYDTFNVILRPVFLCSRSVLHLVCLDCDTDLQKIIQKISSKKLQKARVTAAIVHESDGILVQGER